MKFQEWNMMYTFSSGGPGNPMEGNGVWDKAWYKLVGDLWEFNQNNKFDKKYMFFICH